MPPRVPASTQNSGRSASRWPWWPWIASVSMWKSNMVTELNLSETCTISYSSPFPFLIQFDDSSAGCVPCGQKLFFNCSKWSRKSQILYEVAHGDEDGTAATGDEDISQQISTLISARVGQC